MEAQGSNYVSKWDSGVSAATAINTAYNTAPTPTVTDNTLLTWGAADKIKCSTTKKCAWQMDNAAQEKDTLGEDAFKALKGLSELSVGLVLPTQYLVLGVASKIGATTVSKVDDSKKWGNPTAASADSLSVVAAAAIAFAALTM